MAYRAHPLSPAPLKQIHRIDVRPPLPRGFAEKAREHEGNRDDAVGHVLTHLHVMAVKGIVRREDNPIVTVGAAVMQSVHSSFQNQAAHRLPGQLLITGRTPGMILLQRGILAAARLNMLFGLTDDLHANFNKVDSQLESHGMADAFEAACRDALFTGFGRKEADPEIVGEIWEDLYKDGALPAYEAVLDLFSSNLTEVNRESQEQKLGITEEERDYLRGASPEGVEPAMVRNVERMYDVEG